MSTRKILLATPKHVRAVRVVGRPPTKDVPGWQEQSGGIHLGGGVWALRYERTTTEGEGR